MKKDLLEKIDDLVAKQKTLKSDEVSLCLTPRELNYVRVWIKTAYENEKALDEVLGLK